MESTTQWYYIEQTQSQPTGPVDFKGLADLHALGYISSDTFVWCEGAPEWKPLQQFEELKLIYEQPARRNNKKARQVSRPAEKNDPMAAFQAEIRALESEEPVAEANEEGAAIDGTEDVAAAPGSPEEKEFEDDDGTIYVWDSTLRKFVAKDMENVAALGPGDIGYDPDLMTYVSDEEVLPSLEEAQKMHAEELIAVGLLERDSDEEGSDEEEEGGKNKGHNKRKQPETSTSGNGQEEEGRKNQRQPGKRRGKGGAEAPTPASWFETKHNTSVYVTGLPDDVTMDEVASVFSKCGLLKPDGAQSKIKIYRDNNGVPKGDALVSYLKEPSVDLAIQILDGSQLRPGRGPLMSVSKAEFSMKGEKYVPRAKPKMTKKDKMMMQLKLEKVLGWGGFDDKLPPERITVILHHMFTPDEIEGGAVAVTELEEDIAGECGKLGPVEKVRIFAANTDGVVSVRFRTEEAAAACVRTMEGRFFGGRQIRAHMWDGVTNFNVKVQESAEVQAKRLEAFARELEAKAAAQATEPPLAT